MTTSPNISLDNYTIVPLLSMEADAIMGYWHDILDADLLRYRLCDIKGPNIDDVKEMMKMFCRSTYFAVSEKQPIGEFTLTNFTGKAAQIHFSMHPANKPQQSLQLGREVTDTVLNQWREWDNHEAPYLYSLYGLTPVPNKIACAFVLRTGFKKMGVLTMGQLFEGEPVDAMVTIKTRTA